MDTFSSVARCEVVWGYTKSFGQRGVIHEVVLYTKKIYCGFMTKAASGLQNKRIKKMWGKDSGGRVGAERVGAEWGRSLHDLYINMSKSLHRDKS